MKVETILNHIQSGHLCFFFAGVVKHPVISCGYKKTAFIG